MIRDVNGLRRVGNFAHAVLLFAVLDLSATRFITSGWRELVQLVPACRDGQGYAGGHFNYVDCVTNRPQPHSGLGWYGAAVALLLLVCLLRWGRTSLTLRIAARTLITLGTGMGAAGFMDTRQDRTLACLAGPGGECAVLPLEYRDAVYGLLVGAAVAFALIPARVASTPNPPRLAEVGVTAGQRHPA